MFLSKIVPVLILISQFAQADPPVQNKVTEIEVHEVENFEPMTRSEVQRLDVEKNDSENKTSQVEECDDCTLPKNKPEMITLRGDSLILRSISE